MAESNEPHLQKQCAIFKRLADLMRFFQGAFQLHRPSFPRESLAVFARWLILSISVGIAAGAVGVAFHFALEWCAAMQGAHRGLLFLLPLAGIVIAWMYKRFGEGDRGTNMVLSAIRSDVRIKAVTAPLIFAGTFLTHLFGGSAGREGAALQLGGSIATQVGELFHLDEKDSHVIVMCGTSAAFAALFGTPITAAVFSLEVISVGLMYYSAVVPCTISALTGAMLARYFGIAPMSFVLGELPALTVPVLLRTTIMGMFCACVSYVFCTLLHGSAKLFKAVLPNVYLRVACGGVLVIVLSVLLGTRDYNGAGMDVIRRTFGGQPAYFHAFLLKMLFTAITLGAGYKGGEIVPTLYTGATFGSALAGPLGLDSRFGAGLGMIAVFCGVTNCPITSIILSTELFGAQGLPYFALAAAISYMLSGYSGLYGEQKIVYSKLKAEFIDIKTT